ncbi:hypothetical protein [Aquimarina hainanensis]|uniref:hypothetical protein n=1 Tax=Aquimarina hainanensis TaxID=1578017 RepID=UPI00362334F3
MLRLPAKIMHSNATVDFFLKLRSKNILLRQMECVNGIRNSFFFVAVPIVSKTYYYENFTPYATGFFCCGRNHHTQQL